MNALTAIAATAYALTLWMFAPESVWERELDTAKRNQQNRLTATPEPTLQPEPETIQTSETELKSIKKDIPESTPQLDATEEPEPIAETKEPTPQPEPETVPTPEPIEQAIPETTGTDYTGWTTTQLRELAKQRKLNWRPLINGKRKPLNKPQLIELLTA